LAKSDEGEFELILGNRQLISVFLIVVVLLGVFFSMGYIVGRNSATPATEAAHTGKTVAVESPSSESQPASSSPAAPAQEPPASPPETKPAGTEPATTHPEQPVPAPAPVKPTPVPAAKSKPAPVGPPASRLASVTNEPAAGQYWQVVATARPDAEIISEALTKKGFHTLVTPASREGVFRVLVGPFRDGSAQAEARTKLEAAGFKNSIIKRY
jgi:outer membrane biosynthesis protein TonB